MGPASADEVVNCSPGGELGSVPVSASAFTAGSSMGKVPRMVRREAFDNNPWHKRPSWHQSFLHTDMPHA
jgi:hypothetical protein